MYSFQDTICNLILLYPPPPFSNLLNCLILAQLALRKSSFSSMPTSDCEDSKMVLLKVTCCFSYWPAIRQAIQSVHDTANNYLKHFTWILEF